MICYSPCWFDADSLRIPSQYMIYFLLKKSSLRNVYIIKYSVGGHVENEGDSAHSLDYV